VIFTIMIGFGLSFNNVVTDLSPVSNSHQLVMKKKSPEAVFLVVHDPSMNEL